MGSLTVLETLWADDESFLSQVTTVMLDASGQLVFYDTASGTKASTDVTSGASLDFSTQTMSSGGFTSISIEGSDFIIPTAELLAIAEVGEGGSHSVQLSQSTSYSNRAEIATIEISGVTYIVAALSEGSGLSVFPINASAISGGEQVFYDDDTSHLNDISALCTMTVNGTGYVLAASATEHGLTLFEIDIAGSLTEVDSYSANEGLPVTTPTDLQMLEYGGKTFVFMTAADSGSITVLQVTETGELVPIDQVIDSLDTRFGGAKALDVIDYNGTAYLAVAGNDGGISLFKIMPDGTLVLWSSIADTVDTALVNVSSLTFVETVDGLELIATSTGDTGLTRLGVDISSQGEVLSDSRGTSGDDIIAATDNGSSLSGRGGDDIFIDGAGIDTMTGGNGPDIFQFRPDGVDDYITDFSYTSDKIDLSHFPLSGSAQSVEIQMTSTGFVILFGGERIIVTTDDGMPVPISAFVDSLLFNADHVIIGDRIDNSFATSFEGTNGNDVILGTTSTDTIHGYGGADLFVASGGGDYINGGDGSDTIDYSLSTIAVNVDLQYSALNSGAAASDTLVSIENVIGTKYNDVIKGDTNNNTISGYDGSDRLLGQAGDDILIGGMGADILDGGDGNDTASYSEFDIDLTLSLLNANDNIGLGAEGDTYFSIENLISGDGNDTVYGDGGDNKIYTRLGHDYVEAGGGNDIVVASHGNDIVYGGDGNDVLNGGNGKDRLSGDAGNDRLVGEAGDDTLLNFEGVGWLIAGDGNDFLVDGSGNSVLAGNNGNDRINAGGGNDRVYGDAGDDIMTGGNGVDRMTGGPGNDRIIGGNGPDIFVFREGSDTDTIVDFEVGYDRLFIEADLTDGNYDADQIVADYCTISGTDAIFDFGGGDIIVLKDVTDLSSLADTILIT
ncbi:calcium-binding protein [Celeribacter baekdonensis]|uniref:calcium-binding protein n=1 Tax=Celeribacter baekdonensis TaxID=875171 RepID=UPI003A8FC556